ncbi:hypothetical protein ACFQX7_07645 [Luedemannella flava]
MTQHGPNLGYGTRERPALRLDANTHLVVVDAIRWYVEQPIEREAIATPEGRERLTVHLVEARRVPVVPVAASKPLSVTGRLRFPRMTTLVICLTLVAGVLASVADLVITYVFENDLLAAERAAREEFDPVVEGEVFFTTDTLAFARGWAGFTVFASVIICLGLALLIRPALRGSAPARATLATVLGVVGVVLLCPCVGILTVPSSSEEGTFLADVWSPLRLLANALIAGLAIAAAVLVLTSSLDAPRACGVHRPSGNHVVATCWSSGSSRNAACSVSGRMVRKSRRSRVRIWLVR